MKLAGIRPEHKEAPATRASVLEPSLRGDSWIAACSHPGLLVMYLNNYPVSLLPGSALELTTLNQILFSLRYRSARRQCAKKPPPVPFPTLLRTRSKGWAPHARFSDPTTGWACKHRTINISAPSGYSIGSSKVIVG